MAATGVNQGQQGGVQASGWPNWPSDPDLPIMFWRPARAARHSVAVLAGRRDVRRARGQCGLCGVCPPSTWSFTRDKPQPPGLYVEAESLVIRGRDLTLCARAAFQTSDQEKLRPGSRFTGGVLRDAAELDLMAGYGYSAPWVAARRGGEAKGWEHDRAP